MSEPLLSASGLEKTYVMGTQRIRVLRGLSLTLEEGEIVAVLGASGVGKSTLLHVLGLLDKPEKGRLTYRGEDLLSLSSGKRAKRRNGIFGFVFQFYHLIPELTALENALLPAMIEKGTFAWRRERRELRERARSILVGLGMEHRLKHRPSQLSGGERQRVAIARALMNDPDVLLCDEPTGNLDPETSLGVRDALWDLHDRKHRAMLVATHDEALAARADRIFRLTDGTLVEAVPAFGAEEER